MYKNDACKSVDILNNKYIIFSWDIGGQHRLRNLWKHYFGEVQGILVLFIQFCNCVLRAIK